MPDPTIYGFPTSSFDPSTLPDFDTEFIEKADIDEFAKALNAPDQTSPVIALNDWRPVHQRVKRKRTRPRRKPRRTTDETREGFVYSILKWPLLLVVSGWILLLACAYLITRFYIHGYERLVAWRGQRQRLRHTLRSQTHYQDWRTAAQKLDEHLGNEQWKQTDDYAYYDHTTVTTVKEQLKKGRTLAKSQEQMGGRSSREAVDKLRSLVEACVKNNFVGVENSRLYSETYYGTKRLAQDFIDELHSSLQYLLQSSQLSQSEKCSLAKHLHTNFGRTAFCLSGGASFAWYHFGVARALLDATLLPDVITGTSGGALVAALIATRTDGELRSLLVPALAHHINACEDSFLTWAPRWWRTGARFDSLEWARHCSWWARGSTTFREAYERTGRILNVSCVPSDPYSPTILTNYLTAPDCVIWSAVLASAAVPGILNPVVLMMKKPNGTLTPYSFGHKWKDGSLRTDIPLKALNLHFGVNFSIVSQVNPHINLFFFSSRGTVGRPGMCSRANLARHDSKFFTLSLSDLVQLESSAQREQQMLTPKSSVVTHRRGRGWRGGYLGSAVETYLKLELQKFIKISKHLELLPRPLGQDWSGIWLQQFSGTITIWPKSRVSDFWYILSDPTPERLARMLFVGQQSTFPKLLFIENRMRIERLIEKGLSLGGSGRTEMGGTATRDGRSMRMPGHVMTSSAEPSTEDENERYHSEKEGRRTGVIQELKRQGSVFQDDSEVDGEDTGMSESETAVALELQHDKEE